MSYYSESILPLNQGSPVPSSPSVSGSAVTAVESIAQSTSSRCQKSSHCSQIFERDADDNPVNDLTNPCHGWPQLVKLMVESPGLESFQTFRDLNIKSLLYYQAELVTLKKQLHVLEWDDHKTGTFRNAGELCANVRFLLQSEYSTDPEASRQIKKMKEIRRVLKEYNEALLQYAKLNQLPAADEFNVNGLRTWMGEHGLGDYTVQGPGHESWGDPSAADPLKKKFWAHLVQLLRSITIFWAERPEEKLMKLHPELIVPRQKKEIDGFTQWIANDWIPFWHSLKSKFAAPQVLPTEKDRSYSPSTSTTTTLVQRMSAKIRLWFPSEDSSLEPKDASESKPTLQVYQMSRMRRFTTFFSTVVACLLPTVAIAVLSTIHSQAKLIGYIALFTAIFAMGLMGLTGSGTPRTEIFTATAAFSAVLVVFVQNQQSVPGEMQQPAQLGG
ncbi:uncharacterized protein LY89DRAFT_199624 [Mollisia scopiformis]|uniref:DUF6594 domain-containing protein n=1 Tax=Mollisia scopiformis TaxID=149040 RepID=A0A194WYL7_MOLSC|nr:uncharacterized protein LY89DRAFT_199624 [Mollisia scopiformis]KUJ13040.1 hypothetical protein LY89DRAFT_199624 [Mollisia scopiformis]